MQSEAHNTLHAAFEAAYTFPFAEYTWKSRRARSLWIDLEVWQDALAGPVSSVVENGNCAYVYERDDAFFAGIDDPTALHAWLQQQHLKLTAGLDRFLPASGAEKADLEAMRQFASEMWTVAEKAIEIEQLRWTREHHDI